MKTLEPPCLLNGLKYYNQICEHNRVEDDIFCHDGHKVPSSRLDQGHVWNIVTTVGLKDFDQILHKYSIQRLDELITFWRRWGQGQGRYKVEYCSDLLRLAVASTLGRRSVIYVWFLDIDFVLKIKKSYNMPSMQECDTLQGQKDKGEDHKVMQFLQ